MSKKWEISRREFLQGSGVAIALPVLDAMLPSIALAESMGIPKRLIYVYAPVGVRMDRWTPSAANLNTLNSTMQGLNAYKSHLLVVSGLDHTPGNSINAGDHASSGGAWLTGVQVPKVTSGPRAATSVDQLVAQAVGGMTKIPSLTLSCDAGGNSGDCDSGYSCAYTNNISWLSATTPNTKEVSPLNVFNRLFAGGTVTETAAQEAKRNRYKKSVLDFAMDSANRLNGRLGKSDKLKLQEHLDSVRDLERRIGSTTAPSCVTGAPPAVGVPSNYQTHMRLLYDLLALALKCDATRVATFMLANKGGGGHSYSFLGINDDYHDDLSHNDNATNATRIAMIDKWRVDQLAYFVGKLYDTPEGTGRLLDNVMLVYGSGVQYYSHSHQNLPIVVIGKGGGGITPNRHITMDSPLCNLHLAALKLMGVTATSFGNSTGALPLL